MYSDSTISDFFRSINENQRQNFLDCWNEERNKRERIYISYDFTNKNCEAGNISMVEFGAAKIDVGLPIFNYAVGYDLTNSEPLMYEKYPGSINDVSQLQFMVEKVKGYGYKNIGFILDRGYFSKENLRFMDKNGFAFLLNRCTKGAVRAVFDRLEKRMGTFEFISVFENILTDRGSEFSDPNALETGINGIERTNIYYCDPMRSGQKGTLEQAHTLLRMVLPKGTSFEFLTQWDVNLIVNHFNSTPRAILNGRTPYNVALETLGEDVLKAFQLKPIASDEVNLTPKLIRFNH